MADIRVEGDVLHLRLSPLEQLGALHRSFRVPVEHVISARVTADPWSELRGLRAPGTGFPGVIALGTYRGSFGRDFAAVYQRGPAVVLELTGEQFARLLVSTSDPDQVVAALAHR